MIRNGCTRSTPDKPCISRSAFHNSKGCPAGSENLWDNPDPLSCLRTFYNRTAFLKKQKPIPIWTYISISVHRLRFAMRRACLQAAWISEQALRALLLFETVSVGDTWVQKRLIGMTEQVNRRILCRVVFIGVSGKQSGRVGIFIIQHINGPRGHFVSVCFECKGREHPSRRAK